MIRTLFAILSITLSAHATQLKQPMLYNSEATQKLQAAITALTAEEEVGSVEFLKTVDNLITQGANPNIGREGAPAGLLIFLIVAAIVNENLDKSLQEKVIRNALEHGANPNISSDRGSALHYALVTSPAIVKLLIEHGADPFLKSELGTTPLEDLEGELKRQKEDLEYLQQKQIPGAQKSIARMRQILDTIKSMLNGVGVARSTITKAPHYNQHATTQLQEKLNALKSEEDTSNPEFLKAIDQLIANGADPNTAFQGNKDISLLMLLCKAPYWNETVNFSLLEKVIGSVLRAGANPNVPDRQGDSILSHALEIGSTGMVKLLIEYGEDPFAKDANGQDSVTKLEQRLQTSTESAQHALPTFVKDHQTKIRHLEQVRDILKAAGQKK